MNVTTCDEGCSCRSCKRELAAAPSRKRMRMRRIRPQSSFIEASYVYAPYVPLVVTPTIFPHSIVIKAE
jgi:hypothetical protein